MNSNSIFWWLGGGTEECPFCFRSYPWEAQERCSGCDRGFCNACVGGAARGSGAAGAAAGRFCPECRAPSGA